MSADLNNLRRVTGLGATPAGYAQTAAAVGQAAAQGGVNPVSDLVAVAAILGNFGASPSKENYKKVLLPNAQNFVRSYGLQWAAGAQANGIDPTSIAVALQYKLGESNRLGQQIPISVLIQDSVNNGQINPVTAAVTAPMSVDNSQSQTVDYSPQSLPVAQSPALALPAKVAGIPTLYLGLGAGVLLLVLLMGKK